MASEQQVPVLIIGGGIVGLSASLFLAHNGINSIIIERHSGTSIHPRARSVNTRTMELFRRLGIDSLVREAGASMRATKGIYQGASLKEVIESKPRAPEGSNTEFPFVGLMAPVSPMIGQWVTQDMLEPVLVDAARERGVTVKFYTESVKVEQDTDGVTATLKDRASWEVSTIRAQYLIAADGAKSPIRTHLNVPTSGRGAMGYLLNILFNADLKSLVRGREFSLCIIQRPEVCGLFNSVGGTDRWVFHLCYDPAKGESASDFTPDKCKEMIRIASGMPELEIEIKSILPWEPTVRVAERPQTGHIFLAGDSFHTMPPWGGQGANSGIADAHNLAWKLAAVLKGYANNALLETYTTERLPVGREAAEASAGGADEKGLISVKLNLEVVRGFMRKFPLFSGLGYFYASKGICTEDTWPLRGVTWQPWTLPSLGLGIDGRPGRRSPHLWVENQGKRISTLGLFGKNFVLLAGADDTAWVDASKEVSSILKLEIEAYTVGPKGSLVSSRGVFESAAGVTSHGAILVRPDDFVVYRERRRPVDHKVKLEQAMRQALCL